jgi:hypothetical protein
MAPALLGAGVDVAALLQGRIRSRRSGDMGFPVRSQRSWPPSVRRQGGARARRGLGAASGPTGEAALQAEQRTNAAVERVLARIEETRDHLDGEIEKTRHMFPSALTRIALQLDSAAERRHQEVIRALEQWRPR